MFTAQLTRRALLRLPASRISSSCVTRSAAMTKMQTTSSTTIKYIPKRAFSAAPQSSAPGNFNENQAALQKIEPDSKLPKKAEVDSFVTGLFGGSAPTQFLFPYPDALTTDDKESLSIVLDSVNKYFEESNDAVKNDEDGQVPEDKIQQMKDLGLFGLQVPQDYGGLGANNTMYARLVEIVGKHDLGVGIFLGAHQSIGFKGILIAGNAEQKEKYLPKLASGEHVAAFALTEPSSGSDANSIRTNAVLSEDGKHWILNGSKLWISNGGIAEIFTVFAQTDVTENGVTKKKVTAFIVERSFGGVTNGPAMKKMGIKCSNTTEVYFDNTKIPVENVLGKPGDGFKVAMAILNNGRFGMAAALTGTMKAMIGVATAHVKERTQFGSKLQEYEDIKDKIAQMTLRCYATESTAYLLSGIMDKGAKEYQLEAAISKIFASENAWWVTDETIQILGGTGYMRDCPVERVLRDLRIFRIFEGTNDILRLFVAGMGVKATGKALKAQPLLALSSKFPLNYFMGSTSITAPHQALSNAAEKLSKAATIFFQETSALVVKYKQDVINHQIKLRHVADAAIGIYTMGAVISRASDAVQKGTSSADYEVQLANQYVEQTAEKVLYTMSLLRRQKDEPIRKIAEHTISASEYTPIHPLGL